MPFVKADINAEKKKLQEMMDSESEIKEFIEEWEREYEFRKKLVLARMEAGLTQKELSELSGLNQRAISRAEKNADVSPTLRTIMRYIDALGFKLDVIPK